jgi:hypothetical protein
MHRKEREKEAPGSEKEGRSVTDQLILQALGDHF